MRRNQMLLSRRRAFSLGGAGAAAIAAMTAFGCSSRTKSSPQPAAQSPSAGQPQSGGTFQAYFTSNFPLDPQKGSVGAQRAVSGVMSRVFAFKTGADPGVWANHDLENDLGVSAESPDAVTWTVKLRPDAKFHNVAPVNGHAVEAEDLKATFVRALDPATGNPNRGSLAMIDPNQIQTPDPHTAVFKLKYAYSPFQRILASPAYALIFPREVQSSGYDPAKTVIGSGPFTLDSFTPDVAYIYKKNTSWTDKARPYVDGMRLAIIPNAAQQLAQFTAGSLDEIFPDIQGISDAQQQNPKALFIKAPAASPSCVFFQLGDPASVFKDIRVRQAFSMAIDRDTISKVIWNGEGDDHLFVPGFMGKWAQSIKNLPSSTAQYYAYNPGEAKKLLDAAGASNLQLKFAYVATGPFSTPAFIKQAQAVNSMLNAVGVKTTLVTQDYNNDFIAGGKGSRQGYFDKNTTIFAGVTQSEEADDWLFSYFDSDSTSNGEHLSDPTLDSMIAKQRSLANETERLKAVIDIENYIASKVYVLPTGGAPYTYTLIQPWVQNYQYSNTIGREMDTYSKLWLSTKR